MLVVEPVVEKTQNAELCNENLQKTIMKEACQAWVSRC